MKKKMYDLKMQILKDISIKDELKKDLAEQIFQIEQELAINYTRCCDKLNDEILQPFKDFVNANYWEQDNEYICKETNKKEDLDDIIRYWHQEY